MSSRLLLGVLVSSTAALGLALGCTISTSTDGVGGFGGLGGFGWEDPTGGSTSSGGKSSGGSVATGGKAATGGESASGGGQSSGGTGQGGDGSGGGAEIDCQYLGESIGSPGNLVSPGECELCLEDLCPDVWDRCNTVNPNAACRSGSTAYLVDGETIQGEFDCMRNCFLDMGENFIGDDYDIALCADQCGSAECDESTAGPVAIDAAACMIATDTDLDGCQLECGFPAPI
jgi:hypothetical protein